MKHEREARLNGILGELAAVYGRMNDASADGILEWLRDDSAVFIGGAGRSGLLLRCFAMRLMHMGKRVHLLGDTLTPAAGRGDVLLIGSGSGETESLVAAMRKADRLGLRKAILTTRPDSTMAGLADIVVTLPAPTPKAAGQEGSVPSGQPMGNLFEQGMFLFLDALVMELMDTEWIDSDTMFTRHANLE
ncbi:MAG: SIS domain-containing protein [Planctomycetes bacterium]|nr:SIS domain-containing protein [Planctomycetota bacterium]